MAEQLDSGGASGDGTTSDGSGDDGVISTLTGGGVDLQSKVFKYITTYLLTLIAGVYFSVLDLIDTAFGIFQDAVGQAGDAAAQAPASVITAVTGFFDTAARTAVDVAAALGPLGAIAIIAFGVGAAALTYRVIMAAADSVPILSSVQKFIQG